MVAQEKVAVHDQTMSHRERASEIAEPPLPSGVKAAPAKDPKMEAQDPQDVSSRNDQLRIAHPRLPIRITSGVPR